MTRTLVVTLAGDAAAARSALDGRLAAGEMDAVSLAELYRRLADIRGTHLAVMGSPPEREIGFGLTSLLAIAARPRTVTTIDTARQRTRVRSLGRFAVATAGPAAAQLAISALAVLLQRAAATAEHRLPRTARREGSELRRLLYLRPHAGVPAGVGGSVTHAHELIRALRREDIAVDGFTSDPSIVVTAAADPHPPLDWHLVAAPAALKAIPASTVAGVDAALVRAALPAARVADLVYQRHSRFSLVGALVARFARKPFFLEYNGSEAFFGSNWQPTPLASQLLSCEQAVLSAATRVIVVSEVERRLLVDRGIDRSRIAVVPNGVDTERYDVGGGPNVRAELGVAADERVIGFVGSFGPWHGAPVLARAFAQLARRRPDLRLLLVGDGPERAETLRLLSAAGHERRVLAVGKVQPSRVPAFLDACDVLASPHVELPGSVEFFGSPTKLFEYMAAGKAIVASAIGQLADVLDGQTAVLVPPGNPDALCEALARLLDEPSLAARLGFAARAAAVERHGWSTAAARVISAYAALPGPTR
jgi:glycosyltransferase involved in cell wall biosynthesis